MISNISSGLSVTWFSRCTTFLAPIEKKRNWKSQGIARRNKWEPRWHGLWSHVFKWQLSATYNCIWKSPGVLMAEMPLQGGVAMWLFSGMKGKLVLLLSCQGPRPSVLSGAIYLLSYRSKQRGSLRMGKAMDRRSLATVWRRASTSTLPRAVLWTDIHLLCSSLPTDT